MTLIPPDKYKELEDKAWTAINNSCSGDEARKTLTKGMSRQQKEAFILGMLAKSYSVENTVRGIPQS